jgi:hypothetical protein
MRRVGVVLGRSRAALLVRSRDCRYRPPLSWERVGRGQPGARLRSSRWRVRHFGVRDRPRALLAKRWQQRASCLVASEGSLSTSERHIGGTAFDSVDDGRDWLILRSDWRRLADSGRGVARLRQRRSLDRIRDRGGSDRTLAHCTSCLAKAGPWRRNALLNGPYTSVAAPAFNMVIKASWRLAGTPKSKAQESATNWIRRNPLGSPQAPGPVGRSADLCTSAPCSNNLALRRSGRRGTVLTTSQRPSTATRAPRQRLRTPDLRPDLSRTAQSTQPRFIRRAAIRSLNGS